MDSKCFFALCCILLVSFPTEILAIRPKPPMSEMANGLHLASQIKKLPSYRALSTQKKIGRRELVESLDPYAKDSPTVGSKPVVAAALDYLPPAYTTQPQPIDPPHNR
ncbi:hypothetical protein CTI12_AA169950 [Artemisia annua]|uniref:Uncharacterized protein n=1 Tax=Artemisia annua TaxID=35608 RepID=A0A2U1PBY8_ARTAN|nr:hypothetical protein CTI12_AA169950 [Artemisia annua]